MMKLILSSLFAVLSIVSADTINSTAKNPSMAVLGTQRSSATTIQPWIFPVAVSGAACNSTTDTVAVTSDHSSQLICQSGTSTWQAIGGGDIASKGPNGYVMLSSGVIIQWGITASLSGGVNSGQALTVTFPIPFPTACTSVSASQNASAADNPISVYSVSRTNMVVTNNSSAWAYNVEVGGAVRWMAIGY